MKAGRIVEFGEARQVLHAPKEPYAEALLSAVPSIKRALQTRQPEGASDAV